MKNRVPTFIKLPRTRQFNFKPRYYDADKEELDQRIAVIKAEAEQDKNGNFDADLARFKMAQKWKLNRSRQGHFNKSNLRIALIAGILVLFFYYYLYL